MFMMSRRSGKKCYMYRIEDVEENRRLGLRSTGKMQIRKLKKIDEESGKV